MERAKPFLDREHKIDTIAVGALQVYYIYYMIICNYDLAREYIQKIMSFSSEESKRLVSRFYYEAEFDLHEGKREEAVKALKQMEPFIKESPVVLGFFYQKYQERLGLTEEVK